MSCRPRRTRKAGEYVYKRDVPASLLGGEAVKASFEVDKALVAGRRGPAGAWVSSRPAAGWSGSKSIYFTNLYTS